MSEGPERRDYEKLLVSLKPLAEAHKIGSLRLDMAEVRTIVSALQRVLALTPADPTSISKG